MRRSSLKKRREDRIGYLVSGGVICIFLASLFFYFKVSNSEVEIDKNTLCEKNRDYNKHVILLDITDKYSFIQTNDIKLKVEQIIKELQKGEQLKVYFLTDIISEQLKPAISVCNPGRGDSESYIYSNPTLIKRKWKEKFYIPLSNTINKISNNQSYSRSPLMEMIQIINILEFKSNVKNKKITIISDLIQNSKSFSFFKDNVQTFFKSPYFNKVRTNMSGLDVEIFLTRRDKLEYLQNKNYLEFWGSYIHNQGAMISKIVRIDG